MGKKFDYRNEFENRRQEILNRLVKIDTALDTFPRVRYEDHTPMQRLLVDEGQQLSRQCKRLTIAIEECVLVEMEYGPSVQYP